MKIPVAYIFGYGSLINKYSVAKSLMENDGYKEKQINIMLNVFGIKKKFKKQIIPVKIRGIRRGWYVVGKRIITTNRSLVNPTFLAAYPKKNSYCTGVLIPVTSEELQAIDEREEGANYVRKKINTKDIQFLQNKYQCSLDLDVFYYAIDPDNKNHPSEEHPILRSYVNICLAGCLDIDRSLGNHDYQFTKEFISTTHSWNYCNKWWDDLIQPSIMKKINKNKKDIDKILSGFGLLN